MLPFSGLLLSNRTLAVMGSENGNRQPIGRKSGMGRIATPVRDAVLVTASEIHVTASESSPSENVVLISREGTSQPGPILRTARYVSTIRQERRNPELNPTHIANAASDFFDRSQFGGLVASRPLFLFEVVITTPDDQY
jgi:hypothetical protein